MVNDMMASTPTTRGGIGTASTPVRREEEQGHDGGILLPAAVHVRVGGLQPPPCRWSCAQAFEPDRWAGAEVVHDLLAKVYVVAMDLAYVCLMI